MSVEQFFKDGLLWLAEPTLQQAATSPFTPSTPSLPSKVCLRFGLEAIDSQFSGYRLPINHGLPINYGLPINHGLPIGTVHEWFSNQSTPPCSIFALAAGNLLRQLNSQQQALPKYIAWIGRDIWPTPYLLEQTMPPSMQERTNSVSKSLLPQCLLSQCLFPQCLFIDPPNEKLKLWAIELALRSPAVAVAVASTKRLRFAISRKLALTARGNDALCFLFCDKKALSSPSAAFARWHIDPIAGSSSAPCFHLQLLKCKGAQPRISSWMVELREGVSTYGSNQPALSLSLSTAVGYHDGALSAQQRAPTANSADDSRRQTG